MSPAQNNTAAVIAVTPNPAQDVTITIDGSLMPGATVRINRAQRRLGGKGMNVAAVAAAWHYTAYALGPVFPGTPDEAINPLREAGVRCSFTPTDVPLRETFALTDDEQFTNTVIINERGETQPDCVWDDMAARVTNYCTKHPGSAVTISGSWPPAASTNELVRLIDAARRGGAAAVIVDCAGTHLVTACEMGAIVKPNEAELQATTGCDREHTLAGITKLLDLGAQAVCASFGPKGLVWMDHSSGSSTPMRARLDRQLSGNPTGAGDALVAALATGITAELDPVALLQRGVAWSAAAVLEPTAGSISPAWEDLLPHVIIDQ